MPLCPGLEGKSLWVILSLKCHMMTSVCEGRGGGRWGWKGGNTVSQILEAVQSATGAVNNSKKDHHIPGRSYRLNEFTKSSNQTAMKSPLCDGAGVF